ncbi:MAG TPA: NOP5/NOP56 family protein [archaeon]|nr:NOP5/NOP56 family protein [archaeon]
MKAHYAINPVGVFAYSESGELLAAAFFPKDPAQIVERLKKAEQGQLVPEDSELVRQLTGKADSMVWDKKVCVPGLQCLEEPSKAAPFAARDFRALAAERKWATPIELNQLLSQVQVLRTRAQLSAQPRDALLMQASNAYDNVEKAANTLTEHLREWYGLHDPAAGSLSNEQLLAAAAQSPDAGTGPRPPAPAETPPGGMPFTEQDRAAAKQFTEAIQALAAERSALEHYLEQLAPTIAPNCSAIAGPVLAAKLLAMAGGLERLARLPASTIQLLGAEKALFRHLKGQGKAPKYGLLFAHPAVQQAKEKGKAARLVAAKLSLAARVDFYRKSLEPTLKAELERKLKGV